MFQTSNVPMFRVLASSRTIDTEQEQGERVEVTLDIILL